MKEKFLISAVALLHLPLMSFCQTTWKMTSGEVSFKIKNAGVTVTGRFPGLNTSLVFGPDKLASSYIKGSVSVGTIKTGIDKRDEDLKGAKYFDEGKYKLIDVKSVKLTKKGNQYAGTFNVTMKGVTKQVEIPFEFIQQGSNAEFKGTMTINRRDFGVGGKTLTMADDAVVTIDIKATST
jgi:polyisoprenoid-binding protein YceI